MITIPKRKPSDPPTKAPRFMFFMGNEYIYGPRYYTIALYWKPNHNAVLGEKVYRRCFGITFRFQIEIRKAN